MTEEEQAAWDAYVKEKEEAERRRDRLGLVDLAEVLENGISDPEMLVDDLLVEGDHHLIYGAKESGKTWVLLVSAVQLMAEGKTVLWVDKEMYRRNLADRLQSLPITPEMIREHFVYLESPAMDTSPESRYLWEALLQVKEPSLVVVDAFTEVLADADLSENSGTDVEKWSQAYLTPARRQGAATAVIDHTGHSESGRAVASRQKGAAAKIELAVSRESKFGRDRVGRLRIEWTKNTISAPIPETQDYKIGGETDKDGRWQFVFE